MSSIAHGFYHQLIMVVMKRNLGKFTPTTGGKCEKREEWDSPLAPAAQRPKLASRRFLAGGHLQAISPWHFTSKNSSNRLLYGVRPTKHYVGNPSEIRDRMLIKGQWWPGLGRNGPVQHGFPHRHFDHFVHPPYHIHGIRSIDLCPLDGVINAPIV